MTEDAIRVITFAVDRPFELARCIRSVANQEGALPTRHLIVTENFEHLFGHPQLESLRDRVEWRALEPGLYPGPSSPRMARLRSDALEHVTEPMVCFLDDDNEFTPDHLATLGPLLRDSGASATYSWRRLLGRDGSPFLCGSYPWHAVQERAASMYRWCVESGVMIPGESVMRDGPAGNPGPGNISTVDMNEWLFRTDVLMDLGFCLDFTSDEVENGVGEDDKLFWKIRESGLKIVASNRPTVLYYLGGVSNGGPSQSHAPSLERA